MGWIYKEIRFTVLEIFYTISVCHKTRDWLRSVTGYQDLEVYHDLLTVTEVYFQML